jgi:hypothetical protein
MYVLSLSRSFVRIRDVNLHARENTKQFLGGSEQEIKGEIAKATDVDIDAMKGEFDSNKKNGVKLLVDIVKKVEYSVPQALKDTIREQ